MPVVRSRLAEHLELKSQELGFTVTQKQVSEATGLRPATVNKFMRRDPIERIDVDVVSKLADFFSIPFSEMLDIQEEKRSLSHRKTAEFSTAPAMG